MKHIYVFAEIPDQDFSLLNLGCLKTALEAAQDEDRVTAVIYDRPQYMQDYAEELLQLGVDSILWIRTFEKEMFFTDAAAACLAQHLLEDKRAEAVIFPADAAGNAAASQMGVLLYSYAVTDCTNLMKDPKTKELILERPSAEGSRLVRYVYEAGRMPVLSLKKNADPAQFSALKNKEQKETEKKHAGIMILDPEPDKRVQLLSRKRVQAPGLDLAKQPCLAAGGQGIKSREDFEMLKELAQLFGGALCVSRPVVDKGWFPKEMQVGLSGKRVSPKLYFAVGISGAFQHTAGMAESDFIAAVNIDRNAAVFDAAHFGIVGDYRIVIPMLIRKLKES